MSIGVTLAQGAGRSPAARSGSGGGRDPAASRTSGPRTSKERVLVVDDEPQVLVALEDLLSDDFIVMKANSPHVALSLANDEPDIAVVVSDLRMPQMAGDELLGRLTVSSLATRILLTGFADLSAVIRAVNHGRIFAYATKPWNKEDLRLKVHKAAEHFRLAKELAHERELLGRVLESMDEGVVAVDPSGEVLVFNRRAEQILGTRRQDFVPSSWLRACGICQVDGQTDLGEDQDPLVRAIAGEAQREAFISVKNAVVHGAEVAVSASAMRDEGGAPVGGVLLLREVTDQRRLERQLSQAQKLEAIGLLAGGVAHDFNNILAAISGFSELVLEAMPDGDPNRADLSEVLAASRRAAALTSQLLAFSRRKLVRLELLDLNEVLTNLEKMLCRVISEQIELRLALSPTLSIVKADVGQLEQVLINLAANARDAMAAGGSLTIRTSNVVLDGSGATAAGAAGEFVLLSVSDTGVGMDAETQRRIFEPFFTTKDVGRGTGIGLATVYGIVHQFQGQIDVQSEPGRGTTFHIYLPRARGMKTVPPPALETAVEHELSGTILLVEDEDWVRRVTSRMLEAEGYTVIQALSPAEARRACEQTAGTIDLLLTDIVMPETSGPRLAGELSALRPGLRVLFMSGYSGFGPGSGVELGEGVTYLEKPFTAAALRARVRESLSAGTTVATRGGD